MSNGNFAQLVGIFSLHILNKICGCPTEKPDLMWVSMLGVSQETIKEMVLKIKLSISKDGLGPFACNGLEEQITPAVIIDAIRFSRDYEIELLPFFLKQDPEFIFPTATDDDMLSETDEMDNMELNGFSMLPYRILKSVGEAYISPTLIISLGSLSKQPQQQCASGGSAKPQQQCVRGGSAKPQPQQQQCASGGSAKPKPQPQKHSVRCDSAKPQSQQQCARVNSADKK
jgi:hypothetical protein